MAKELRISIVVPLPDDMFDQADVLHEVKPLLAHILPTLATLNGTISHEVVTPRAAKGSGEAA